MKKVLIYSTENCTYCKMAKDFFAENNVEYTDYNVGGDLEKRKEMVEKSSQMGVPVIDIDGKIIVGFDKEEVSKALGI